MKFVCILILTRSVLPHQNVCLSNGSQKNMSVIKYASERILAFIGTIHNFFPFCRWTLQTTQYLCEHIVEWACKGIFFWLYNLAQIVLLCVNNKLRIFLIWNYTLKTWSSFLHLGYIVDTILVQTSALITNHIILLYFSDDKFWNIFLQRFNFYWPSSL